MQGGEWKLGNNWIIRSMIFNNQFSYLNTTHISPPSFNLMAVCKGCGCITKHNGIVNHCCISKDFHCKVYLAEIQIMDPTAFPTLSHDPSLSDQKKLHKRPVG